MSTNQRIRHLRDHLNRLVIVWDGVFSQQISDDGDHLKFMALTFAARQGEHARSLQRLGDSVDSELIARSMLDGMSQLLWSAQEPDERPRRWRLFAAVKRWRISRRQTNAGTPLSPEDQKAIDEEIATHGTAFLTAKGREAIKQGKPMADPYHSKWHGRSIKALFDDVGGERLYDDVYGPQSEFEHWDINGFAWRFDAERGVTTLSGNDPAVTATALAVGFQCLWQSLKLLDAVAHLGIGGELDKIRASYLTGAQS